MKKTDETRTAEQTLKAIEANKVRPKSIADEREPAMATPDNSLERHSTENEPSTPAASEEGHAEPGRSSSRKTATEL